ncbi:stress response protein isoform X1 [Wolffia australiana]
MGKNQAYKAMQRARVGSSTGGPEDGDEGMTDGSFHSPEWHAARLASLRTSHTITWEEYKRKQREDEAKKDELEADKDKMMREYRAQLDAERAEKLAHGRNHSSSKSHRSKADRKERDHKKRDSKKRKRSRKSSSSSPSSSSSSSSESSSSESDERGSRRSKSHSKSRRKEKKRKNRVKNSGSGGEDAQTSGPVPLSKFFGSLKS